MPCKTPPKKFTEKFITNNCGTRTKPLCKWASGKIKFCGLHGCNIGEQPKIIVPSKEVVYPGMAKMGKSFITDSAKFIKGGMKRRSVKEQQKCLSICKKCSEFVVPAMRCRQCGCSMRLKARWPSSHCSLGKW
ncbi:MAG: hypothetical protein FVQ80_11510 [Planctomycetes bacterium]|nr:hypothetical protein [Planctomycetota bacterium]